MTDDIINTLIPLSHIALTHTLHQQVVDCALYFTDVILHLISTQAEVRKWSVQDLRKDPPPMQELGQPPDRCPKTSIC